MKQKKIFGQKIICTNRKASFNFFFKELSKCISKNLVSIDDLNKGIEKKFLREDLKDVMKNY